MKSIFATFFFSLICITLLTGCSRVVQTTNAPTTNTPAIMVVQTDEPTTYTIAVEKAATVQEMMEQATKQGFSYEGKNYPGLGLFIESINAVPNDPSQSRFWVYSINGQKAQEGVSTQMVTPGDTIIWTFENPRL